MPASPIGVKLDYPNRWKWKQKIIIPDDETSHYYSIWYEERSVRGAFLTESDSKKTDWYAWLMCCEYGNFPYMPDAWYQVEELMSEHRELLNTIEMVFDISFHESIWTQISPNIKIGQVFESEDE